MSAYTLDHFEEIFDLPALLVSVVDREGRIVRANSAARVILGYEPGELVGETLFSVIHPDDGPASARVFGELLAGRSVVNGFRNRCRHRNGGYRWISWHSSWGRGSASQYIFSFGTDVTATVDLENQVVEQRRIETRYRTFFEQSSLAMQIYDTRGVCVAANQAWEKLFDTTVDQLRGYNLFEDPQVRQIGMLPYVERAFAGEAIDLPPRRYVPAESGRGGRARWIQAWFSPVKDEHGTVRELFMVLKDVTGEREAVEALSESESRFRNIADAAPVMIWMTGVDTQLNYINRQWLDYTGRPAQQELGEGWTAGLHPADFVRTVGQFQDAFAARREFRMEFRLRRADGEYRTVLSHGIPRFSETGEFQGYVGVGNDVTDAKRAERAIEEERRWLEKILDSIPIPTLLMDPETGAPTFANSMARRLAGGEFSLHVPTQRYHTAYRVTDELDRPVPNDETPGAEMIRGRPVHDYEMVWHTPTGRYPMLFNTEIVPAQLGHAATGIMTAQDISRLKSTEAELKAALRARDEFLSVASHELRTPITSLALQAQLRLRKLARGESAIFDADRLRQLFAQDLRRLERLTRLIEDTLDMARIGAGRLSIEPEPVDLANLVSEVAKGVAPQFEAIGAGLRVDAPGPVPARLDPFRIEQALQNLLSNALKYGEGKPVELRLRREGDRALVEVRDQGRGIAPEDQARIFERFERAVPANETNGLGLGLYIADEIVDRHGGRICVESEPGKGAAFIVELPLEPPA